MTDHFTITKFMYLTILGCYTYFSKTTSLKAEAGSPCCFLLILIFFKANLVFFYLSITADTLPKVPYPSTPKN